MTKFKTVRDSRIERPAEIDTTSSAAKVYERRNIRQETTEMDMGGEKVSVTEWIYEQREYTRDEYALMLSPAIQGVQQSLSEIELAIASL